MILTSRPGVAGGGKTRFLWPLNWQNTDPADDSSGPAKATT